MFLSVNLGSGRCRYSEHFGANANSLDGEESRRGGDRDRGLETGARNCRQGRERMRAGATEQTPLGDGCGSVPTCVGKETTMGSCSHH